MGLIDQQLAVSCVYCINTGVYGSILLYRHCEWIKTGHNQNHQNQASNLMTKVRAELMSLQLKYLTFDLCLETAGLCPVPGVEKTLREGIS